MTVNQLARMGRRGSTGSRCFKEIMAEAYQAGLRESFEAFKQFQPPLSEFLSKHPVVAATAKLETWITPENDTKAGRLSRATKIFSLCKRIHASDEFTRLLIKPILRKTGRPVLPEVRKLAVDALDAKLNDPEFSWQKFANTHCPCAKPKHDVYCRERIRQAAMELQQILRALGCKPI